MKITVSGKGGSGKTTIAGTMARALARKGQTVLAIDGDSNPNLAITLGIRREEALRIEPLPADILRESVDFSGKKALGLAIPLDEISEKYGIKSPDGLTLLVVGRVDHAGTG